MVVTNPFFELPSRRLYTWKSAMEAPAHIVRNQIDFILINRRFRNALTSVVNPGADIKQITIL